ncbi:putative Transcription elongation factor SPT6, partial [Cardiosporidium cionae]
NRPRITPSDEIEMESKWLARQLQTSFLDELSSENVLKTYKAVFGNTFIFPADGSIKNDIIQKCGLLLSFLLNDRFEIPFILYHKRHLLCPPLTDEIIWKIYELDLEWYRLRERSKTIDQWITLLASQRHASESSWMPLPSFLMELQSSWDTEEELEDLQLYLMLHFRKELSQADFSSQRVASEGAIVASMAAPSSVIKDKEWLGEESPPIVSFSEERPSPPTSMELFSSERIPKSTEMILTPPSSFETFSSQSTYPTIETSIKTKGRSFGGLGITELVDRYELSKNWEKYLLTADEFAANIENSYKGIPSEYYLQHRCPDIGGTDEAMLEHDIEEWCEEMTTGPFNTGKRVLDVLIKYFAKILSTHPKIRALLRKHFRDICSVSTW